MKDPFPIPPIPWLSSAIQPLATHFNLTTLPLHIHQVLLSALLYTVIFYPVSPILSRILAPNHYPQLPRRKRLNWDAHVVSMVQSCLINAIAIWVLWTDNDRKGMGWEERVWGYTGGNAMVQALAAGYFVWDLVVTSLNLDVFGLGTLAHAIAALLVYSLGFVRNPYSISLTTDTNEEKQRPIVNSYSCIFILWELSTPFLNVHWFMDKLNMTGSTAQLYNGIALLGTFFTTRLLFGTYQSFLVAHDFYLALNSHPSAKILEISPFMTYVTEDTTMPAWAALSYLAANLTLNFLNFYWFFKMVSAVRKRFEPAKEQKHELISEAEVDMSSMVSGVSDKAKARRRKA